MKLCRCIILEGEFLHFNPNLCYDATEFCAKNVSSYLQNSHFFNPTILDWVNLQTTLTRATGSCGGGPFRGRKGPNSGRQEFRNQPEDLPAKHSAFCRKVLWDPAATVQKSEWLLLGLTPHCKGPLGDYPSFEPAQPLPMSEWPGNTMGKIQPDARQLPKKFFWEKGWNILFQSIIKFGVCVCLCCVCLFVYVCGYVCVRWWWGSLFIDYSCQSSLHSPDIGANISCCLFCCW